VMLTLKLFGQS